MTTLRLTRAARTLAGACLATFVLACGSASPSSPSEAGPSPSFDVGSTHAYPDLENSLPAAISGRAMDRSSFAAPTDDESDSLDIALTGAGKDPANLEMAVASPSDEVEDLILIAYRYPGMSGTDLLAVFTPTLDGTTVRPAELGDKQVSAMVDAQGTGYAYAGRETLYIVGGEPDLVEAAIRVLL